jgi:hypothetical protein
LFEPIRQAERKGKLGADDDQVYVIVEHGSENTGNIVGAEVEIDPETGGTGVSRSAMSRSTMEELDSFQAMACSLAPDPTTSRFIVPSFR